VSISTGTTPPGAAGEQQAAKWVRQMFADIAPRYDLLNRLLSFNIDRRWRKALVKGLTPILLRPDARVLDLCCGTGDVLLDLASIAANPVLGADFCHPMLLSAARKARARGLAHRLFEADALDLPLASHSLDAIAIAFGFRNLVNYRAALAEFARVLKPGGMLAILEFSHPRGVFIRAAYGFYSKAIPLIGALVSRSREAYAYLPASVAKFPPAEQLRDLLEENGFVNARFELLTGGIAALHTGERAATGSSSALQSIDVVAQT
jgi:demethylmenaquinone methyltransferase/2-methoxy-6-polyprenyl-1,4-benzoquinol methylase